jgi:biopolymer transport protein ExbD
MQALETPMSFEVNDSDEIMNEINMTPLVDVMLVLLIIFIITIPVVQHAVKVELPRTSSSKNTTPPENLQLAVDAQGLFFLGKQPVPADALEITLREHAAKNPQPQLYIRGDKKVPYEHVAEAMSAAQRAGLTHIGFVTEAQQR